MHAPRILLACALLASRADAQTQNIVWHMDSSPTSGSGNAFPFGSEGVRYQTIVPFAAIGRPTLIQDIFVAGQGGDVEIVYGDIEIRMGLTQQLTPTNNWNTNNPNPTVVYRGPLRIAFKTGAWRGIGLPALYPYVPAQQENLCIEVIVWNVIDTGGGGRPSFYYPLSGSGAATSIPRAYLFQWVQGGGHANTSPPNASPADGCKMGLLLGDGNMVVLGRGCTGSGANVPAIGSQPGTWPRVATVFNVLLTGAKPTSVALFSLGSNDTNWGGLPLPLELTGIGAPRCFVWNNYLTVLGVVVDAGGAASMSLPIPPTVFGLRVFASWVNLDAGANAAGITTSGYAKLILGS